jgi:hypothetical protein
MSYKFGFLALAGVLIIIGVIPFALSQVGQTEPSMEIDMIAGQTQNPFRIQDENDNNIFQVKPNGGFDPLPVTTTKHAIDTAYIDSITPILTVDSPNQVITETAESGAGIYQWIYTVTQDDIDSINGSVDSLGAFSLERGGVFVSTILTNTGAGAISINESIWINDQEIDQTIDSSVATGNYVRFAHFWGGDWRDANRIDVGDVIGIKLWTNTSGDLELTHIVLTHVPELTANALTVGMKSSVDETTVCPTSPIVGLASGCSTFTDYWYCNGSVNCVYEVGQDIFGFVQGERLYIDDIIDASLENTSPPTSIFTPLVWGFYNESEYMTVTKWK